ncbi:MAG: hypothetical protein ACLRFP_04760 [Alphaproteobacteria bacterium]
MYTEFNIPVIRTVYPATMTKSDKYLQEHKDVFHISLNGMNLIPHTNDTLKIARELVNIRLIYNRCNLQINEQVKTHTR